MSIAVTSRVWKHTRLRGSARTLVLAIADRADESGYAWPGIGYLAERVGTCERQTQRLVRQAQALGEIYVQLGGGRKKASRYLVVLGLDLGGIAGRLRLQFGMEPQAATRTAADLLERQKGDIKVILSRKEKVTSPSPLADETVTSVPPDPSPESGSSKDSDRSPMKTPSESAPAVPSVQPSPGRRAITGERLREAYRPTPGRTPLSPSSASRPVPVPEGHIALYRDRRVHYARPGELRTICGQPIDRFDNVPFEPGELQVCHSCERAAGVIPPELHVAIINAWWYAIPDTIRPPGKPPIAPNAPDACALRDAGISPDQVRKYVTDNSPGYALWARKKSFETKKTVSPVMSLYHVRMHIKAHLSSEEEHREQNREQPAEPGPPRPRVSGIKF